MSHLTLHFWGVPFYDVTAISQIETFWGQESSLSVFTKCPMSSPHCFWKIPAHWTNPWFEATLLWRFMMSRCKFQQFIVELQIRPVKTIAMPRSNEIQFQIQTWIGPFWYCINYLESSILYMSHPLHWYEVGILWITRATSEKYQNWALFASNPNYLRPLEKN